MQPLSCHNLSHPWNLSGHRLRSRSESAVYIQIMVVGSGSPALSENSPTVQRTHPGVLVGAPPCAVPPILWEILGLVCDLKIRVAPHRTVAQIGKSRSHCATKSHKSAIFFSRMRKLNIISQIHGNGSKMVKCDYLVYRPAPLFLFPVIVAEWKSEASLATSPL